jgi:IS1 family transposase
VQARCEIRHTPTTVDGSCITAISHDTGKAVAFWFGTREHGNLDKLLALLSPLEIGKVYTDGNYAYYERFDSEI